MAARTFSRDSLKLDREMFDLSKLDVSKFDVSKLDVSKLDLPKFDVPKFDRSRLDSFDINEQVDAFEKAMTARLDQVQERLPSPADRMFHLQRVMVETGYSITKNATETLVDATTSVVDQARTSTEKVVDSFRTEAKAVRSDVTRMAQASKATAGEVVEDVAKATAETTDTISEKVESLGHEAADYGSWSKDDLYHRAQELDIAGRSAMSKDELIAAIAG